MKKLLFAVALVAAGAVPASAQVAVVAHPGVADASADKSTLVGIYSLDKTRWSDGSAVQPVASKEGFAGEFYSAIGQSESQMKKVWMRKKLSGEGQPPATVGSAAEVIAKVSSTPGAIGFVPASAVTSGVKVLAKL